MDRLAIADAEVTVTRKIGTNKGSPRIWLEGHLLDQYGFPAGTRYRSVISTDVCCIIADPNGEARVVSKAKPKKDDPKYRHPIIDFHKKALSEFTQDAANVSVTFKSGEITIRRE
jgi:DNA (cytosine-5)-methyltransferase 1